MNRNPGKVKGQKQGSGGRRAGRVLRRLALALLLVAVLLPPGTGTLLAVSDAPEQSLLAGGEPAHQFGEDIQVKERALLLPEDIFVQPIYEERRREWEKQGIKAAPQGTEIRIPAVGYAAAGGFSTAGPLEAVENYQGRPGKTLLWIENDGWVEWEFDTPLSGLYEITVEYYPYPGQRASIQRELYIDDELPYREANRILFQRSWRETEEPKFDNRGNNVRPPQGEVPQWLAKTLEDADGRYREPFQFYLTQGQHRMRWVTFREPIALGDIVIHAPIIVPPYKEKLAEWQRQGLREIKNVTVPQTLPSKQNRPWNWMEGEDTWLKSDPTIRGEVNFDALASPYAHGLIILNSMGGWRWRLSHQWVQWKVTVPEEGLYALSLKYWQGWGGRMPRYRSLKINGQTPFHEVQEIRFRTNTWWDNRTLGTDQFDGNDGKPFLFHFKQGDNAIQMQVNLGPMAETYRTIDTTLSESSGITREWVMITGHTPDPNMEWDLHEKIPNLLPRLQSIADRLDKQSKLVEEVASARNFVSGGLFTVVQQLRGMVYRPHTLHAHLEDFVRSQTQLGGLLLGMQNHPLQLDYLMVHSADARLPRPKANFFEAARASVTEFLASFTRNYTGVGSTYQKGSERTIEVWIGRGTEWGMVMKDMIEDNFTPATGIKVNLHIIPAGNLGEGSGSVLILAQTAGEAPDVAVGVPSALPVDFAIRNGILDVSRFPDYRPPAGRSCGSLSPGEAQKYISCRFRPGALVPFRFPPSGPEAKDWAVPETQDFGMMFYRKDIMGLLGLQPPDTWEEMYDMLLVLQQNGMDLHYPPPAIGGGAQATEGAAGLTPFLFQSGGSYYTEDGKRSALESPEALAGFMEWTDLYTNYKIPRESNFFTRFRTGEQPIGISGYWTYVVLSVAAPELTGRWEMRPMPGHRRPDGTIDRTTGGGAASVVIFKSTKQPQAAWEFVKWWTGFEAQQRFGGELEALIGVEARWNTANVEALTSLPWPKRDIASVLEQWRWFRENPVVLGGYFTGRHVYNAWNRVVLQGWNPREALEEAVYDIDKELAKKHEEFGFPVDRSAYRRR